MEKVFTVERDSNKVVLFNLKGIEGLEVGNIFFRRNEDTSIEILQDFEYLDKEYLNNIIDKLSEGYPYDFCLLETKSI